MQAGIDLTKGNHQGGPFGRLGISRHPLVSGRTVSNQKVPGANIMGFADGHASLEKLNNIRNYTWHVDYTPKPDPWTP